MIKKCTSCGVTEDRFTKFYGTCCSDVESCDGRRMAGLEVEILKLRETASLLRFALTGAARSLMACARLACDENEVDQIAPYATNRARVAEKVLDDTREKP